MTKHSIMKFDLEQQKVENIFCKQIVVSFPF